MRITSTISVSYKDLFVAVMIFATGSVSMFCMWTLVYGTQRHGIEQRFGAKAAHRQKGFTFLKDITRDVVMKQKIKNKIVDPRVNGSKNDTNSRLSDQEKGDEDFIRRVYPEEYALRDTSKFTSFAKSSYRIEGDRESVKFGDTLHVTIHSRDGRGQFRDEGGDFWFATLATKRNDSGTTGRIVDYDNGTYSVYFKVGWAGELSLEITLVHPSHVGSVLTDVIWNERDRVEWSGRFEAPNGSLSSDQRCVLRHHYVPLARECLIAYPQALGQTVLVCSSPGRGIPCDKLSVLYNNFVVMDERIKSVTRNYYSVFAGDYFKRRLSRGPRRLHIKESRERRKELILYQANLPACQPDLFPPQHGLGYWEDNLWYSLVCRTKPSWDDPAEIGKCLRGKNVFFLGDSTVRQWLEVLLEMLGVPSETRDPEEPANIHRNFQSLNASVTFRQHPLVLTTDPESVHHRKLMFEVEVLDGLKSKDCNYVVAISAWAHYPQWTRESYMERVGMLRDAVLRLRARCPDVKIVVTGPHPREQPSKETRIHYNDLITYRMGEILEDAFSQSGALYLDRWDMNVAYPSSKTFHMPMEVIQGELSMFLSFICGVKNQTHEISNPTKKFET